MANMNPNCCGGHCQAKRGEVRVYPLGGGGNLILCFACWAHENRYRLHRQNEFVWQTKDIWRMRESAQKEAAERWPQLDWNTAEVYE